MYISLADVDLKAMHRVTGLNETAIIRAFTCNFVEHASANEKAAKFFHDCKGLVDATVKYQTGKFFETSGGEVRSPTEVEEMALIRKLAEFFTVPAAAH